MDCFIIMPISTPESALAQYGDDKDHFKHVLDHLFVPAVKEAEMNPIPPIGKGADIIPAEIIKHLETADLVLCDMSTLNANVFFELGIRTAVNKPVALVRDEATPNVPFDTLIINHYTYSSTLAAWTLDNEVQQLKEHVKECAERADVGKTLWRYFSLSSPAAPLPGEPGLKGKMDFLSSQIEALRQELRPHASSMLATKAGAKLLDPQELHNALLVELGKHGISIRRAEYSIGKLRLVTSKEVPNELRGVLNDVAALQGLQLSWISETSDKKS